MADTDLAERARELERALAPWRSSLQQAYADTHAELARRIDARWHTLAAAPTPACQLAGLEKRAF